LDVVILLVRLILGVVRTVVISCVVIGVMLMLCLVVSERGWSVPLVSKSGIASVIFLSLLLLR
jgi:hypothetical protein